MADNISNVIDPKVFSDIERLIVRLGEVDAAIKAATDKAISVKIDLAGADSISQLNAIIQRQQEAINQLNAVQRENVAVNKQLNDALKESTNSRVAETQAALNEAKAGTENARQKEIETKYTIALTKEKERLEKAADKEAAAAGKLSNAYEQLKKDYKVLADEAKRLGAEYGVNSAQALKAAASAMKMHESLLLIEKSVGQAQRNVGNYNSAAMAMSQILREAPSFAYSFSTGLMGISNNIPILVDEITKLKTANQALKASGAETIPVWKTLMSAFVSPVGIITTITAVVTILFARMSMLSGGMSEAEKSTKKFNDSLAELTRTSQKAYDTEIQKSNELFDIINNLQLSYGERVSAIEKLIQLYPELLGNIEREVFLTGQSIAQQEAIATMLSKKAAVEEKKQEIELLTKRREELVKLIEEEKKSSGVFDIMSDGNTENVKALKKLDADLQEAQDLLSAFSKEYYYAMNPKHEGRILSDIDNDIKAQERLRDSTEATSEAHGKAIARLKELSKERQTYLGVEEKAKKPKAEREDKSADDLAKALFERRKAELEADMAVQKEIGDNTQVSLDLRLAAYKQYYNDVERLAYAEGERDIKIEQDKRERLAKDLKSGKIKSPEYKNEIEASKIRELAIIQKYENKVLEVNTNLSNANDKIWKDEVVKREQIIKRAADNNKTAMDEELLALSELYAKGEIKTEEYEKRKRDIQNKYATQHLTDVVAYLKSDIENSVLSNDAKKKLIDELTDYERKALEQQIKNNEDAAKRKEKSWKDIKDLAIQLAQETMRSIVTIVNNQFAGEQQVLQEKRETLQRNAQHERNVINATTNFEVTKANQLAKLEAQTAAQDDRIAKEQQALAIRKAKFDKAAAEAGIVLNTAMAIAKVLPMYANPVTVPFAIAQTALITAIGAAQFAAAASTPIPQYKFGTPSGGTHTPMFIAGDGGEKELIAPPNKPAYWSNNKSTLYNEPLGTHVIPMNKLMQYATANVTALPQFGLQQAESQANNDIMIKTMTDVIGGKLDNLNEDVVTAIIRSRTVIPKDTSVADAIRSSKNMKIIK